MVTLLIRFRSTTTIFTLALCVISFGCSSPADETMRVDALFTQMNTDSTGIDFENKLMFDQDFNIFTYRNFYNGGGVGVGDINNDGLIDIYFTGNQTSNKLYLNKGNFQFEDITQKAGVAGSRAWSTGVSMADVNGDGLLDIYVCNSGDVKGDNKQNELFINNGDLTFTESAERYGVADPGFSTHAVFFDYDKDGDLDLYVLNNSYQAIGSFNLRKNERTKRNELGGDKLMRNDGDRFVDVSEQAGIFGSTIGFGLGVTVGDVNKDGWPDIFISNDFFERDYLYINRGDGTFKELLPEFMKSISGASMGADMADINNDGWPDIFVTEMLPHDHSRLKSVTTFEDWNRYQYSIENDYHHQFTRNMLQLNNGNNTFSEIGRLAGVEATDWSWGALMFDMDNDGLKDIFVANGIYQDLTDQDFLQYASNDEFVKSVLDKNKVDYKRLTEIIPSNAISNVVFHNKGNLAFEDVALQWGMATSSFSNGSAYADFDNDGDLDLVVNNVNMKSFVYRNNSEKLRPENNYLKFQLTGASTSKNTAAFGASIELITGGRKYYIEQMPIRGFQSSVDPRPNIGLGNIAQVDTIIVRWPDGRQTLMTSVKSNQTINVRNDAASFPVPGSITIAGATPFIQTTNSAQVDFCHTENSFVDFDRDFLIFQMLSNEGSRFATGDINGDGMLDLFIGGAKDQSAAMYINTKAGFKFKYVEAFETDKTSEDIASIFFDADGDGDLDLFVCSGGSEFSSSSAALTDRLYLNDGLGNFSRDKDALPLRYESSSCVAAADFDNDGDIDLFVGSRLKPFAYGAAASGFIFGNDGHGKFTDITTKVAHSFKNIGLITDATWADVDGDGDPDLVVVGEYLPVKVFINTDGKLEESSDSSGLQDTNGWWNCIEAADLDADGDIDFVIGNHGLNSRFRASRVRPVSMVVNDFDKNGTIEQIICSYFGETSYPLALRHDLINQLPYLKKKYLKYENYKNQTVTDIFTSAQLQEATTLHAYELKSCIMINDGSGKFTLKPLPVEAQISPVYAIEVVDINADSHFDIVVAGNQYRVKPQAGRYDASFATVLIGDGKGNYQAMSAKDSGLKVDGEVRDITRVKVGNSLHFLFLRNNDCVVAYRLNEKR